MALVVLIMKSSRPPFEDCLAFVESIIGIELLDWQKEVLQDVYERRPAYYFPSKGCGRGTVMHALKILEAIEVDKSLSEFIKKEKKIK